MTKEEALTIASDYLYKLNSKQPVSIDSREILDENPIDLSDYWCFKSYYENLDPRRPSGIQVSMAQPYYLISKENKEIKYISSQEYASLTQKPRPEQIPNKSFWQKLLNKIFCKK